jgi:Ca2+-binding RTX toxin-like protein
MARFSGSGYVETGEGIYLGGVSSATGKATQVVDARARERRMRPELQISCFESPSLHGSGTVVVTGDPLGGVVIIPPIFNDGRGAGGGGGDYGSGDPTEPQRPGGCTKALEGTSGPDSLVGGGAGDVIFGFGGNDRIKGAGGHDCLIGGPGVNAYDAGPGKDYVDARNGRRELVRCGSGKDRARLDRRDGARGCERVNRV